MASYRFCRPDDIPLLIEAINQCYCVHFPPDSSEAKKWDKESFKLAMHNLDLWPGYCVVSLNDGVPISVLISAKREKSVDVLKLATHPQYLREGHASHLLDSLKKKLAILAPAAQMQVQLPKGSENLAQLFTDQGYKLL